MLSTSLSATEGEAFDYYSDGIWDAYLQINKDIQRGLDEKPLTKYRNKYLVAMNIDEVSTVNIIFYKTVGVKNGLTPEVVSHIASEKNYLVFGSFSRKPNARDLKKRLLEYKLEGIKIFDKNTAVEYKRNPLIVKKLISDLSYSIKGSSSLFVTKKASKKTSSKKIVKKETAYDIDSPNVIKFLRIREKFCRKGFAKDETLYICNTKYSKGDNLEGFSIKTIEHNKKGDLVVLLGNDGLHYKIRSSWCKSLPKESGNGFKTVEQIDQNKSDGNFTKEKDTDKEMPSLAKEDKEYICDFTKISTGQMENGSAIRIKDTGYHGNSAMPVRVYETSNNTLKIKGRGKEYIYLGELYFNRACTKK